MSNEQEGKDYFREQALDWLNEKVRTNEEIADKIRDAADGAIELTVKKMQQHILKFKWD